MRDRKRNEHIRLMCKIESVSEWVLLRQREWDAHVDRMRGDRIVKIVRDNRSAGWRAVGSQRKRWKNSIWEVLYLNRPTAYETGKRRKWCTIKTLLRIPCLTKNNNIFNQQCFISSVAVSIITTILNYNSFTDLIKLQIYYFKTQN